MNRSIVNLPTVSNTTLTLEEHLEKIKYYGRPSLCLINSGWYCAVNMNTNTTGTSFEVKSEFGHPTPLGATKQCHERIVKALKELTK